jgi:hypothetical protein
VLGKINQGGQMSIDNKYKVKPMYLEGRDNQWFAKRLKYENERSIRRKRKDGFNSQDVIILKMMFGVKISELLTSESYELYRQTWAPQKKEEV